MYQVRTKSSAKPLKFRFCDTRGLEESQGIDAHDLTFLLDGNVPDGYHVCDFDLRLVIRKPAFCIMRKQRRRTATQ